MGKSLPIFRAPDSLKNLLGLKKNVTQFDALPQDPEGPGDGRTVDDFKPYLIALNLTKRCNLRCEHCYLDATTKMGGGTDELTTAECLRLIDQIAEVNRGSLLVITGGRTVSSSRYFGNCPTCGQSGIYGGLWDQWHVDR